MPFLDKITVGKRGSGAITANKAMGCLKTVITSIGATLRAAVGNVTTAIPRREGEAGHADGRGHTSVTLTVIANETT